MDNLKIYRRRFIPNEIILLKDDIILYVDDDILITKWNVLKPRDDFAKGMSVYFLSRGYKVSKIMDSDDNFIHYYCDIIETVYDEEDNAFIFNDLLADVIVYKDDFVEVLDIAEISDALDEGLIKLRQAKLALRNLGELLDIIYSGNFCTLTKYVDR